MEEKTNNITKSFEVIYMEDGSVSVKSTGPKELTDGEIYNEVKLLADMVKVQEIREACKEGAYIGAQVMFSELARMRAQQDNAAAAKAEPTLE